MENYAPVLVDDKEHGRFYSGDTYILLASQKVKSKLKHDIFFWIGESTSRDEQGAAAIMVIELDEILGGSAVQHRQVRRVSIFLTLSSV